MKKVIGFIIVIIIAAGVYAAMHYGVDYTNTNSKFWKKIDNTEISMTIPKTMKEEQSYYTSTGWSSVAVYSNSKAVAVVTKNQNEEFQDLDIEKYINSTSINGTKLKATKINGGFYTTYIGGGASAEDVSEKNFSVEAYFQGKDALYSVKFTCALSDRADYEPAMMEWLASFKLK